MLRALFRLLLLGLLLVNVFTSSVWAQETQPGMKDGTIYGYDSSYVISFRDNLVITLVNELKAGAIDMSFQSTKRSYALYYKANPANAWGFGFDYKWLTFEFTKQLPWQSFDPAKGESKNSSLGFGVTGRKLTFRNFYEYTKGYYLENTDAWLAGYNTTYRQYYLRPDIETFTYFSSLNYTFNNKRFSNNASIWQLERQMRFAGTFVAGLGYIYNAFSADSSIIPTTTIDSFSRSNNNFFSLNSLGINLGYMCNFAFTRSKKFFITLAIIPGFSRQWGEVNVEKVGIVRVNQLQGVQSESRLGFGYNGDRWYTGFIAKAYANYNVIDEQQPLSISNQFYRLYFGYRFNPISHHSKFLKKLGL